jgi:hypothetical protein
MQIKGRPSAWRYQGQPFPVFPAFYEYDPFHLRRAGRGSHVSFRFIKKRRPGFIQGLNKKLMAGDIINSAVCASEISTSISHSGLWGLKAGNIPGSRVMGFNGHKGSPV